MQTSQQLPVPGGGQREAGEGYFLSSCSVGQGVEGSNS